MHCNLPEASLLTVESMLAVSGPSNVSLFEAWPSSGDESKSELGSSGSDPVFLAFEGVVDLSIFLSLDFLLAGLLEDADFWSLDLPCFLALDLFFGLI